MSSQSDIILVRAPQHYNAPTVMPRLLHHRHHHPHHHPFFQTQFHSSKCLEAGDNCSGQHLWSWWLGGRCCLSFRRGNNFFGGGCMQFSIDFHLLTIS